MESLSSAVLKGNMVIEPSTAGIRPSAYFHCATLPVHQKYEALLYTLCNN